MVELILILIVGGIILRLALAIGGAVSHSLSWEDRMRAHVEADRKLMEQHPDLYHDCD